MFDFKDRRAGAVVDGKRTPDLPSGATVEKSASHFERGRTSLISYAITGPGMNQLAAIDALYQAIIKDFPTLQNSPLNDFTFNVTKSPRDRDVTVEIIFVVNMKLEQLPSDFPKDWGVDGDVS